MAKTLMSQLLPVPSTQESPLVLTEGPGALRGLMVVAIYQPLQNSSIFSQLVLMYSCLWLHVSPSHAAWDFSHGQLLSA